MHFVERFLARQMGLMGKTPTEEAWIDCVAEHCRDVKDAQMRKGFSAFAKDKPDEEKATAREEWYGTDMPQMLEKINKAVNATGTAKGCAVGSAPSLADVAIFCLLRDCLPSDKDDVASAAKNCDVLNTIADSVEANTGVAKWLIERPETMF
jgi:glutathione S-transferase